MDKLILGLLMLKKLTVYGIRAVIKTNFQSVCSDSLGSIQAALKRLLAAGMVTFSEYVEKSVNKKRYAITDKGRKELMGWLQTPADISNSKNMELGKFLFMGLLPSCERASLINEIISNLEKELDGLLAVQSGISDEGKAQVLEYWKTDAEYYSFVAERSGEIARFQELTLQHGIDNTKFNIEWFKNLRQQEDIK